MRIRQWIIFAYHTPCFSALMRRQGHRRPHLSGQTCPDQLPQSDEQPLFRLGIIGLKAFPLPPGCVGVQFRDNPRLWEDRKMDSITLA